MRLYKLYLHINLFAFALIIVGANSFKIDVSSIFVLENYSITNSFDMQWINELALMCLFQNRTNSIITISVLIAFLGLIVFLLHWYKDKKNKQKTAEYKSTLEQKQVEINNIYSFFSDIYVKTDNKGNIEYVSPSILAVTGYESIFYAKKHISELFACPEEWNDVLEALKKADLITNKSYSIETRHDKVTICSATITPIQNSKGIITGYNGVLKDFSERLSTQYKIEEIVSILKTTLNFSNTGITKHRISRNTFYLDDTLTQLLGYPKLSKNSNISKFFELVHQDEKDSVQEGFNALVNKARSSFTILCRFQNTNGKYLLFSNNFSIHNVDKAGNTTEILGIHTQIEKQKELELNVLDCKRKISAVCNSTRAMVFIVKNDLIVTDINNASATYFNKPKSEAFEKKIDKLFIGTKFEILFNKLSNIISKSLENKTNISNQEMTYKQGNQTHYLVVNTNIYISVNNLNCLLTIDDITKSKLFEKQTQNKLNILEKREQEIASLMRNISNEIINPINEILVENQSNSTQQNAYKILDIVENINNLAALKTESYSINIERFNVIEFLNNLKETLTKNIEDHIQLICEPVIATGLEYIYTDAVKLKSLITSTVFTITNNCNPKSIEIAISYIENTHLLLVKISSNDKINNSDSSVLEILKDLASTIGASFMIETLAPNEVIYKFGIKDRNGIVKTEPSKHIKSLNVKILIVEDEEYNVFYLSKILQMAGYETVVAEDGQTAVDTVKQDAEIQLVLMDIRLPGIDGIETSKRIKEFKPDLPIIAQTAFNLNSKEDRDMEKYCDDYIQKPIISKILYDKIESNLKIKS
ncbi:MAG: response regulator [Bacteroidales bacterium]|nr:response regulator [Bacteroidales bacterium]